MKLANSLEYFTADFVMNFLLMDFVALFIPRAVVSLIRGREKPDMEKPHVQAMSPSGQYGYYLKESWKGLNWGNFWEEFGREAQTGPLVMVAQSVVFGVSSAIFAAKSALMLRRDELHTVADVFTDFLPEQAEHILPKEHAPQAFFKQWLSQHSSFKYIAHEALPEALRKAAHEITAEDKPLYDILLKKHGQTHLSTLKMQDILETWLEEWNRVTAQKGKSHFNKAYLESLERMEAAFARLVHHHNQALQCTDLGEMNQFELYKVSERHLAAQRGDALQNIKPTAARQKLRTVSEYQPRVLVNQSAASFIEIMEKGRRFIEAVHSEAGYGPTREALIEKSQKLVASLIRRKFSFAALATAAAGCVVILVSKVAQAGKEYPANRLMKITAEDKARAKAQHANLRGILLAQNRMGNSFFPNADNNRPYSMRPAANAGTAFRGGWYQ